MASRAATPPLTLDQKRKRYRAHPAVYSDALLPHLEELVRRYGVEGGILLDPFAGEGHKLARLAAHARMKPRGIEIERGYFDLGLTHPCVRRGNSTRLPRIKDGAISAVVTSPVYPNGMADDFQAADDSVRHTYAHRLRLHLGDDYVLDPNNTASMNPRRSRKALEEFYAVHIAVWAEMHRVLVQPGALIVNTKSTPRDTFTKDTYDQLVEAGFVIVEQRYVPVRGLNMGANQHNKKAHNKEDYESLIVARRSIMGLDDRRLMSEPFREAA